MNVRPTHLDNEFRQIFRNLSIPDRTLGLQPEKWVKYAKKSGALKKADFTSLRGGFKFNTNGYPIQDFYLTKVAKRPDGKFQTEIVEKVFENYGDRYAKECTPGT